MKRAKVGNLAATILATCVVSAIALWPERTAAFTSCYQVANGVPVFGCGSGHYTITLQAMALLPPGVAPSGEAQLRLSDANEQVDLDETDHHFLATVRSGNPNLFLIPTSK